MRISFFDDRADFNLGAQRNLLLLAQSVAKKHDVIVASTAKGLFLQTASDFGLRTLVCEAPSHLRSVESGHYLGSPSRITHTFTQFIKYQHKLHRTLGKPDVIITSNLRSSIFVLRTRLAGTRLITYVQNDLQLGWWAALAGIASTRLALISKSCINTFPEWYRQRALQKSFSLPSGRVMPDRVASMTCNLRLICVASITERKGQLKLLDLLDLLHSYGVDASLTLVGGTTDDPDSSQYFEQLKNRSNMQSLAVEFVGWTDQVESYLLKSDIFVLSSRNEGLPGVIIEAMSTGLPVVAMDAGGIADAVVHGETGYVVAQGNVEEMAVRIKQLNDKDRRISMGRRAREIAEQKYSLTTFANTLLAQLE